MNEFSVTSIRNYLFLHRPINDFRDYAELIEKDLEKRLQVFHNEASQLSEEDQDEYYEFYIDEYQSYAITFAQTHRKSLFITIYSFLEKKMYDKCEHFEENSTNKLIDTKGKGIFKYRRYLVNNIGIQIDNQLWEKVVFYNEIRNKIIHSYGELSYSNNDTKLKDKINKQTGFDIDARDNIMLQSNACINFLDDIEQFLLDITNYKTK